MDYPIPILNDRQMTRSRLISGKLTLGSLHEDVSIVSSIMMNDNTLTEKEIISMGLKDFGVI